MRRCLVAASNLMISGYIADEVPSGGRPELFYLFIGIVVLSIVNFVVVFWRSEKR